MKHEKPKIKIRTKVFIFLLLMSLVMLVLLWCCQSLFLPDIYKHIKLNELYSSGERIAANLEKENLETVCDELAHRNELCILVTSEKGNIIASSENLNFCVIHHISVRDQAKLYLKAEDFGGKTIDYFRFDASRSTYVSASGDEGKNEECIILTLIKETKTGEKNIIFVNSVLSPVSSTVRTLNVILIFVSILLIITSVLFSIAISKSISKPLTLLNSSAKLLGEGKYEKSDRKSRIKEIAELSDTLDSAADDLKKADELKKELIANVSHDLRTPLTMISGYSEVMRDIPSEMTKENLNIIIEESNRLTSLVNDLLDVSQFQSGNVRFEPEVFNFTNEIENATARISGMVGSKDYKIDFSYDVKCTVCADKKRILQVFYNLLNNAITHTGEDKTVNIRQIHVLHRDIPFVRIEVSDSGDGIPEEELPLIWDRYYKVDKFHKRASNGSGLGLSIVKSIIETHGGYYGVFSKKNVGSTFWFEIKCE